MTPRIESAIMSIENPNSIFEKTYKKDFHLQSGTQPEPDSNVNDKSSSQENRETISNFYFGAEKKYPKLITKLIFGPDAKNSPIFLNFWHELKDSGFLDTVSLPNRLDERRPHQFENWDSPLFLFILEQKFHNKLEILSQHQQIAHENLPAEVLSQLYPGLKQEQIILALKEAVNGAQQRYDDLIFSHVDKRTGLWNRETFNNYLQFITQPDIQNEQLRHHVAGYIYVMLDLDHFKNVNDTYGHQTGDRVLLKLAQTIKNNQDMRDEDLAFRYGGEEFGLFLPISSDHNLDPNDQASFQKIFTRILTILQRINQGLKNFPVSPTEKIDINFSAGGHFMSIHDQIAKDSSAFGPTIVGAADKSLYVAKESGRNQLVLTVNSDDQAGDKFYIGIINQTEQPTTENTSAANINS